MTPLDYLSVRFHFRGELHHDGSEWKYLNGRSGMSTIECDKLCLQELKKHLADHVSCSDEVLNGTTLYWKFHLKGRGALVVMNDEESVLQMVKHVTDVGIIDLYPNIPKEPSPEPSDWDLGGRTRRATMGTTARGTMCTRGEKFRGMQR